MCLKSNFLRSKRIFINFLVIFKIFRIFEEWKISKNWKMGRNMMSFLVLLPRIWSGTSRGFRCVNSRVWRTQLTPFRTILRYCQLTVPSAIRSEVGGGVACARGAQVLQCPFGATFGGRTTPELVACLLQATRPSCRSTFHLLINPQPLFSSCSGCVRITNICFLWTFPSSVSPTWRVLATISRHA